MITKRHCFCDSPVLCNRVQASAARPVLSSLQANSLRIASSLPGLCRHPAANLPSNPRPDQLLVLNIQRSVAFHPHTGGSFPYNIVFFIPLCYNFMLEKCSFQTNFPMFLRYSAASDDRVSHHAVKRNSISHVYGLTVQEPDRPHREDRPQFPYKLGEESA